jgi:ParB family chromosome partitioning protein
MNATSPLHPVPLSAIDLADRTYCLTPWETVPPGDALLTSIRRFGILHPPILQQIEDNSHCVVAGRKRIIAAQHLAPDRAIFCRIIPADLDKTAIFLLILEEANAGTPLNIVEQIVFFEKLLQAASMDEAIPMLELLGYKPQKHILMNLLKLRSLSAAVLQAMHAGTVHQKNAGKLLHFSIPDQELIVQLITALHFGGSKQQKLIELGMELIMRKGLPLKKILADFPSADALEQPLNIPQHGAALLSWLYDQCCPQLSLAENNFNRRVGRLDLPPTMRIDHSPAFENEELTLSLRFPDWDSLEEVVKEIRKLMPRK